MSVCELRWNTATGTVTAETDGRTLGEAKQKARAMIERLGSGRRVQQAELSFEDEGGKE